MTDTRIPPRPAGADESRPIPPHGPVSPDGRHPWPRPSPAARAAVYGGLALAVAGLTAGTIYLGRKLAGSDRPPAAAPLRAAAQPAPRRRRPSALAALADTIEEASTLLTTVLAASRRLADHGGELSDQFHAFSELWRKPPAPGTPAGTPPVTPTAGKEDAAPGRASFSEPGDERLHRL